MENIKIVANGIYLPSKKIKSEELEEKLQLEKGYIEKRTGIKERYYAKEETIEEMALQAAKQIIDNMKDKESIELIITATTSTNLLMPGISNYVQKNLKLKPCICLDILAGCGGFINAFDIAKLYIDSKNIQKALIIGVDKLSQIIDKEDIGTAVVLSDGAGATLVEKDKTARTLKTYVTNIKAEGENNEILTYEYGKNIFMDGKEVYKYAITKTVLNINELLNKANMPMEEIKYIIPHQSNLKIMKAIATRLHIGMEKMYTNIETKGNTFCASIPIALYDMQKEGLLQQGNKVILLGYGGGLNIGSILIEI